MTLTPEQLKENFDKLLNYVETYITGERQKQLLDLYKLYEERMMFAPASGREHYHNAFPGGYLVHVNNVVAGVLSIFEIWQEFGAKMDNFTQEEMVFAALNHDLGKIGDLDGDYYVPNESDWHRTHQGKIYNLNPAITYMNVSDRTFFMLQHYAIRVTQNEYLGILLTDGLYEEKNKSYYITYDKDFQLRNHLPIILHHADMMSLHKERDLWKAEMETMEGKVAKINPKTAPKKGRSNPQMRDEKRKEVFKASPDLKEKFEKMFSDTNEK